MSLSNIFQPLPAYKSSALASALSGYGPDGGVAPPGTPPTSPPTTSGVLTPIRGSIDSAEGINMTRGQEGQPYAGAGANASGPSVPTKASQVAGSNVGSGGGFNFGFDDDPILARIRAFNQQQIANAESSALAARKQAEIGYGYDPNIQYEDQGTQEAAKQNAFSTLAQLLFNHGERGRSLDESLNKSNLFYSGERGRQLGLEGRQYTMENAQANSGFQNQLQQIEQMVLQAKNAAQEREMQGAESAYERRLQFALANGLGGGGGGGGSSVSDFERNGNQSGVASENIMNIASQLAPSYNGQQFVPGEIMHNGAVEVHNGQPGVYVKYVDPTGRQAGDTVWVPTG